MKDLTEQIIQLSDYQSINIIKALVLCCLFILIADVSGYAQNNCRNIGFELGNFTNWICYDYRYSDTDPIFATPLPAHTIMTDTTAYDANTGYALKMIPSGYKYSCRLGNDYLFTSPPSYQEGAVDGSQISTEYVQYDLKVDSTNALVIFKIAPVILDGLYNHTDNQQAYFQIACFDQYGKFLPDVTNYKVIPDNRGIGPQFKEMQEGQPQWMNWKSIGFNLSKYIGQTISVLCKAKRCYSNYHYCYAYIVAKCQPLTITVRYCRGDVHATLTAPEGFDSYDWYDTNEKNVGKSRVLTLTRPSEGDIYYCEASSAICGMAILKATVTYINKYRPVAAFSSNMLDCYSNKVQFTNLSTAREGSLLYKWDFEESPTSTSAEKDPQYSFATSGLHPVSLVVYNAPSYCTDTVTHNVESFAFNMVGIKGHSTYCSNQTTSLKGYGAYSYTWSNSSTTDSIQVGAPGGKYWIVGRSSSGCVSDTASISVTAEPDWNFGLILEGDSSFCSGDSATLTTTGNAVSYLWNTGQTTPAITVKNTGNYMVTGTNARGCQKIETNKITVWSLPDVNFKLSSSTIDKKHNTLTVTASGEESVQYVWEMGDGQTEMGSSVTHAYSVPDLLTQYKIHMTATNQHNCVDTVSQYIMTDLFIPNIFSPNGDGINDVFMPDTELCIFDRNGLELYRGTSGWEGTYKGKKMAPDTYFYIIRYINGKKKIQVRKGYVILTR
jgi:gliding motility-associated-like protein